MKKRLFSLLFSLSLLGGLLVSCSKSVEPEGGYTVSFETDGGTPISDYHHVFTIEEEPVTTKEGYRFISWYKNSILTSRVYFPLTVNSDMTLYAKWEKEEKTPDGTLIASSTTTLGTANAYILSEYNSEYLSITINVSDKVVYTSYKNTDGSLNGMNDNVELYISPISHQPMGLLGGYTFKVMVIPSVGYEVRKFLYSQDGYKSSYIFSNSLDIGIQAESKINKASTDGYNGYTCTIKIPYSVYSLSEESAPSSLSFYFAMRNTDANNLSTYSESSFLNSERRNAWSYFSISKNGEFSVRELDTILLGDNYFDSAYYLTANTDFKDKEIYLSGISGSKAIEWNNNASYFERIAIHNPKKVVMHLGMFDIVAGDKNGTPTYNSLLAVIGKLHGTLPNCKIYWLNLSTTFTKSHYIDGINKFQNAIDFVNSSMNEYAEGVEYLSIIDFKSVMRNDISFILDDGMSLNALGCNILAKLIYHTFDKEWVSGSLIGDVDNLFTTRGVDFTNESSGTISVIGDHDQYSFINRKMNSTFSFGGSFSLDSFSNGDPYPKMGMFIKGNTKSLFFYFDMQQSNLEKAVGYVQTKNNDGYDGTYFDWSKEVINNSLNLQYRNGEKTKLSIEKTNTKYLLKVSDSTIFEVGLELIDGDEIAVGFLSFNSSMTVSGITIA